MRTRITFAFLTAALVGGLLSSCYVPQPPFECSPASTSFWAKYDLVTGTGTCASYTGDFIRIQRYLPAGTQDATIAVMASKLGAVTRAVQFDTRDLVRVDPNDPKSTKESARGPLASLAADEDGVCKATLSPADQNLPAATQRNKDFALDGGVNQLPATHVVYDWKNFRFLNTARFPGTIVSADLNVTVDACQATYKVQAIWPPVGCETDEDCNPNPNLDAGRVTGSGLSADYKPVCSTDDHVCIPTVSFDDLVKLK